MDELKDVLLNILVGIVVVSVPVGLAYLLFSNFNIDDIFFWIAFLSTGIVAAAFVLTILAGIGARIRHRRDW
jgi:hypothetical protein